MIIGYIRISTTDQNTARQEVLMKELGAEQVFIDRMSGKNTDRPELKRMMNFVREGIAIAKQNGVYKGRKPIEHPRFNEVVSLWKSGTITATEAMKRLDMKPSTFYRKVKQI